MVRCLGAMSHSTLGAVVHAAYEIVSDTENGRFCVLPVAPRGVVHDDLLLNSARDDALSDSDLEQWFKDSDSDEHS